MDEYYAADMSSEDEDDNDLPAAAIVVAIGFALLVSFGALLGMVIIITARAA